RHRRRRRVHRAVGPAAELPRRRGAGRHDAAGRGDPRGGGPALFRGVPRVEARPGRRAGPPRPRDAPPAGVPQRPLPVPHLRPPGGHLAGALLAGPRLSDRPAPHVTALPHLAGLADEGPGPAALLLVRGVRGRCPRPAAVLAALPRQPAADLAGPPG